MHKIYPLHQGGGLLSDNVQDAIEEVNSNKVSKSGDTINGDLLIEGTYNPNTTISDADIRIGNLIPSGTVGNKRGILRLRDDGNHEAIFFCNRAFTENRYIGLQDRSGEIAFTNQLPTIYKRILRATSASFGNIPGNCMGIVTFRNYQGAGDQDIYMRHFLVTSDSAVLDKVLINTGNTTITGLSISYNSTNSAITFSWTNEFSYFISILIFPMS